MQDMNIEKKNYRIFLFGLLTVLFWASLYTYVPILTNYTKKLGASNEMAGIIVGSYGFVQMLLRIPLGIASDRFHKRKLFISLGLVFAISSSLGLLIFKNLSLILIFRGLAGAAAATWVDFTILFSSYYKHEEATKAIGTMNFLNTVGTIIAMLIGSYAADAFGWKAPFALGFIIGISGLLLSFFVVEKFEEKSESLTLRGILGVVTDKTLMSVSFLAILSQILSFATVFGFTPLFADQCLHASKGQIGMLSVFSSLPNAVAALIAGTIFSVKFGEKKTLIFGFALTGIFSVTIPFTHSFIMLLITQAIAGFGRGLSFPLLMGLSIKNMPTEKRATSMGFFQAIYGIGMFIGPVIMGVFIDVSSLSMSFIYMGIIGILSALIAALIIRTKE